MDITVLTLGLAFLAGALSLLSPCVLPIAPIVIASASRAHRFGPLALAAGLCLAFVVMGTVLAWLGSRFAVSLDGFQMFGALVLIALGLLLLSSQLSGKLADLTSGIGNWGNQILQTLDIEGLRGQFLIGCVLGLVWTPCTGPTLGAAVLLASQGKDLGAIALVMASFSLGASLPLLLISVVSQKLMARNRGALLKTGSLGKKIAGWVMLIIGLAILTGANKIIEGLLTQALPQAWIDLTTRY